MDLLRGTFDLLILQVLELRPLHGVAVADRIRQVAKGTFDVPAGSLFPALLLEQEGWIEGEWSLITEGGSNLIVDAFRPETTRVEKRAWSRTVEAVGQVIDAASE